jgi:putative phosphoribosyl transferase
MQRFTDRAAAGQALAAWLQTRGIHPDPSLLVVGLARGGVIVAAAVARALHAPLDAIIVRKLGLPEQPELAMGAIAPGVQVLNEPLIETYGIDSAAMAAVVAGETRELRRREAVYRAKHPAIDRHEMRVLLVDDGIATGMTMLAAIRSTATHRPAQILVAAPVGSRDTCQWLRHSEPGIICHCLIEDRQMGSIGQFYKEFEQVSDEEVIAALG